jgi:hypothetical protein
VAWRQGIEKVHFVRLPDNALDELTYSLYVPITNDYTVIAFDPTNKVLFPQRNRRVTSFADFVLTAADLADIPGNNTIFAGGVARNIGFNPSTAYGVAYQNLAGPGTIEPGTFFTYNKVGPIFFNTWPNSQTLGEEAQSTLLIWGSFDGTTNDPVVYPNGTSIANIENQLLIQIRPTILPAGNVNVNYTASFTATGGQPPYHWSLAPGSPGLPPGLTLSLNGTIFGKPTQGGTFDFVIRMRDAVSHTVDYNYALTINP